jgi:hypothetical protein
MRSSWRNLSSSGLDAADLRFDGALTRLASIASGPVYEPVAAMRLGSMVDGPIEKTMSEGHA